MLVRFNMIMNDKNINRRKFLNIVGAGALAAGVAACAGKSDADKAPASIASGAKSRDGMTYRVNTCLLYTSPSPRDRG